MANHNQHDSVLRIMLLNDVIVFSVYTNHILIIINGCNRWRKMNMVCGIMEKPEHFIRIIKHTQYTHNTNDKL